MPDRSEQLLAHVRRYGITTVQAALRLYPPNTPSGTVSNTLNKLVKRGELTSLKLAGQMNYYVLPGATFDTQTRNIRLGVLYFTLGKRKHLTPHEFFSHLGFKPIQNRNYCLDEDKAGTVRLCEIRVDLGTQTKEILRRSREHEQRALEDEKNLKLRELIISGLYCFGIMTWTASKYEEIHRACQASGPKFAHLRLDWEDLPNALGPSAT